MSFLVTLEEGSSTSRNLPKGVKCKQKKKTPTHGLEAREAHRAPPKMHSVSTRRPRRRRPAAATRRRPHEPKTPAVKMTRSAQTETQALTCTPDGGDDTAHVYHQGRAAHRRRAAKGARGGGPPRRTPRGAARPQPVQKNSYPNSRARMRVVCPMRAAAMRARYTKRCIAARGAHKRDTTSLATALIRVSEPRWLVVCALKCFFVCRHLSALLSAASKRSNGGRCRDQRARRGRALDHGKLQLGAQADRGARHR